MIHYMPCEKCVIFAVAGAQMIIWEPYMPLDNPNSIDKISIYLPSSCSTSQMVLSAAVFLCH